MEAAQAAANTTVALRLEMEREPRAPKRSLDPRRRGCCGSLVIQTVYKDGGMGTPWPMLRKSNYHEWSTLMSLKMQAHQLWDTLEYGDLPYHDDRRALEAFIAGVPPEM
jgi:hypothetical protein